MLREHWQAHRRLTRRVIGAFPQDAPFTVSVGGMRPSADLAWEIVSVSVSSVRGVATGTWARAEEPAPTTREDLLRRRDEATAEIDRLWPGSATRGVDGPDRA